MKGCSSSFSWRDFRKVFLELDKKKSSEFFQKLEKRELAKNALLGDREQLRSVAASGTVRTCSAFVFDN
jgi:hypothetical protein